MTTEVLAAAREFEPLCMSIEEFLAERPLSVRTANAVRNSGCRTAFELKGFDFSRVGNAGRRTQLEIKSAIESLELQGE